MSRSVAALRAPAACSQKEEERPERVFRHYIGMAFGVRTRQAGMVFILITLFIDILGIGIIVPILPDLVKELLGRDGAQAAVYYGVIISTYATMQFLCAPVLGACARVHPGL